MTSLLLQRAIKLVTFRARVLVLAYDTASDFQLHASGKAGVGGGGGRGAYMTWLLLATEPSKVVVYPCHYKNHNFVKHVSI